MVFNLKSLADKNGNLELQNKENQSLRYYMSVSLKRAVFNRKWLPSIW